ncbi:hypothetical protein KQY27_01510 [Methanobrevibacter sp. TMH8]|uniref:PsbP-related protein n=1 Tax=Methanobrevibacter sp. TMH8 TaxID=2848611 RepID=UPI001CCF9906|nr:PsbP-related protein [Methanobrevibacter sp. TMH8]MBZ9570223.1 hypothetical protein [Methanobrevibacter sp. TMH8]
MKIGKLTAIFLSVVFFVIVLAIIAISIGILFSGFSFSNNWIIRIILLAITFFISRKFYNYIYTNVKIKEGKDEVAVYSKEDKKRKIAVFGVLLIFIIVIVYISAGLLFLSDNSNDNSNVATIKNFNNSDISFNYSSDWSIESNNSTDIVLVDYYGNYLYISKGEAGGYSLDELYNVYKSVWDDNKNISVVNSSNVVISGIPAIETYLKISSNETVKIDENIASIASFFNIKSNGTQYTNSYDVLLLKGDNYYSITYYYTGDLVNREEFKTFIKSFKI